jgi:hypothetical protein
VRSGVHVPTAAGSHRAWPPPWPRPVRRPYDPEWETWPSHQRLDRGDAPAPLLTRGSPRVWKGDPRDDGLFSSVLPYF